MTPNDLPPQAAELMIQNGAAVLFGPCYLENSLQLMKDLASTAAPPPSGDCFRKQSSGTRTGASSRR